MYQLTKNLGMTGTSIFCRTKYRAGVFLLLLLDIFLWVIAYYFLVRAKMQVTLCNPMHFDTLNLILQSERLYLSVQKSYS